MGRPVARGPGLKKLFLWVDQKLKRRMEPHRSKPFFRFSPKRSELKWESMVATCKCPPKSTVNNTNTLKQCLLQFYKHLFSLCSRTETVPFFFARRAALGGRSFKMPFCFCVASTQTWSKRGRFASLPSSNS